MEEAVDALARINADYAAHSAGARAVAPRALRRDERAPAAAGRRGALTVARIVVAGYLVRYPLGGYAWCAAHYLLGLRSLGHDVWLYEDTGYYDLAYDPTTGAVGRDYTAGVRAAGDFLDRIGLAIVGCSSTCRAGRSTGPRRGDPPRCSARPTCCSTSGA